MARSHVLRSRALILDLIPLRVVVGPRRAEMRQRKSAMSDRATKQWWYFSNSCPAGDVADFGRLSARFPGVTLLAA
jgi:hypothetical protein